MSKKIKKIVFFVEHPFDERDYDRFGIEIILRNGFSVEVWDFTPFLKPQVHQEIKLTKPKNCSILNVHNTLPSAVRSITQLTEDSMVVFFLGFNIKSIPILKAVSKHHIKYAVFTANALPSPLVEKSRLSASFSLSRLRRIRITSLFDNLITMIPIKYFDIKPARLALAGGNMSHAHKCAIEPETLIKHVHALDYDIYLKECGISINENNVTENNIAVFLDEYFPYHPDWIHRGVKPQVCHDDYYPLLCDFFDYIEVRCGVKVIIAAHPRSYYESMDNCFGGREIIKGKTMALIKKSSFMIAHCSTSVNFVVLYKKPCIFLTSNKISKSIYGPYIESLARQLGKRPINLDHYGGLNLNDEFNIDDKAYSRYKKNYIKMDETDNGYFWQIFSDLVPSL